MQEFPHRYSVAASATSEGPVAVTSKGLEALSTAPPVEFDGPGDRWSPETLLIASLVDCFALTFRAIARASSLEWVELRCEGEGELDRADHKTRFTGVSLRAFLTVAPDTSAERATHLLQKAEASCLITNSLACPVKLEPHVVLGAEEA